MKSWDVEFGGEKVVYFLPQVHSFESYQDYSSEFNKMHPILDALWPNAACFDLRLGECFCDRNQFC